MEEAILGLPQQFAWAAKVENAEQLKLTDKFIVGGMGGSHLAAGLFKIVRPKLDLLVHRDYGLPRAPDYFLRESLFIACSYSGNTAETIDFFKTARAAGLNLAVITTGGTLLELAQAAAVPFIRLPLTDIQPRSALGYFAQALKLFLGGEAISPKLEPETWREAGRKLAAKLTDKIPLIYGSTVNQPLAYNWKIKFNETSKIPAFYNVFPELNHNELEGFGSGKNFAAIMLHDEADDHRIHQRMALTADLYQDRGLAVEVIKLTGATKWEKIFNSLLLADWAAFYLAKQAGVDPESAPLIEEIKRLLTGY